MAAIRFDCQSVLRQQAYPIYKMKTSQRPLIAEDLSNLAHDEELWQSILAYDLSTVTETFAERNELYGKDAKVLEIECKRFLYLAAITPNLIIAPTKPIDEYWHQFVLFTQEYQKFCNQFAGWFVHHNPLAGPDHETFFKRTQHMVQKVFGQFKEVGWWLLPKPATSCNCTNESVFAA